MSSALRRLSLLKKDPADYNKPLSILIRLGQFIIITAASFDEDSCTIRASGLTFTTLLAIVPIIALLISLFNAFGALGNVVIEIQDFIVEFLIPTRQDEIIGYINDFVDNSSALGTFGLLFFAISSIMLLVNIDSNFNTIWGIRSRRSFLGTFTTYTSVIVFGALFVGASFSIGTEMFFQLSNTGIKEINILLQLLIKFAPNFLMFIGLLLMIMLIPSAYVKFSSAFLGAFIGTLGWIGAKNIFNNWMNTSVRNSVIYGSIASIPIFFLWMYISWIIILVALEITFVHQYYRQPWKNISEDLNPSQSLLIGFEIYLFISRAYYNGDKPVSRKELIRNLDISAAHAIHFTELFCDTNLLINTGNNKEAYIPSRSLNKIMANEVVCAILGNKTSIPQEMQERITYEKITNFIEDSYKSIEEDSIFMILDQEVQ